MKRIIGGAFVLLLITAAWAKVEVVPLLASWKWRQGSENTIWMEQRAKIGSKPVNGYIQGTGGADDALMGFQMDDGWDLLEVTVGYLATTPEGRSAEFSVESDGDTLYTIGPIESKAEGSRIRVPLKGRKRLLLRISPERYNGTAGAAWGAPTLYRGLPASELEATWNLKVDGSSSPLSGSGAPNKVMVPIPVPNADQVEATYIYKIKRDSGTQTVIVEREP